MSAPEDTPEDSMTEEEYYRGLDETLGQLEPRGRSDAKTATGIPLDVSALRKATPDAAVDPKA